MTLGEEIPVIGNWFNLYFTENNGMAFGLEFGGEFGKLALSIFRILAIFVAADGPSWIPSWLYGYDGHFVFFRPIFNIADSAITVGVTWLLIFERKHLSL